MSSLPYDCLRMIFLHLPTIDRIRCRRVCKTWRDVSDDCWRAVTSLSVTHYSNIKSPTVGGDCGEVTVSTSQRAVATTVMKLCAPHLRELSWRNSYKYSLLSALEMSRGIEKLDVTIWSRAEDDHFAKLLGNNRRIKYLEIFTFKEQTSLKQLSTDYLEDLDVEVVDTDADGVSYVNFAQLLGEKIRDAKLLTKLSVAFCALDDTLRLIGHKSHLKSLEIWEGENYLLTHAGLMNIVKLMNLRVLNIYSNADDLITDKFLRSLSKKCKKLENICFRTCGSVTDEGLWMLSLLPELKELTVYQAPNITDCCLLHFSDIERIMILNANFTNVGVTELLRKSSALTTIHLSGERFKMWKLKVRVAKIVKERENFVRPELWINSEEILSKD